MANRRAKVIDKLVNPAVLPGMVVIAGRVTVDNTKTVTITFPAKSVWFAIATLGVAAVARTVTITGNTAVVVYTAAADGELNYFIIASETETIADVDAGTSNVDITPIS